MNRSTIFLLASVGGASAMLFTVFFQVAAQPLILPAPNASIPTGPNSTLALRAITKTLTEYGWHPCAEDPGVWCKGKYYVNETIMVPTQLPNGSFP